MVNSVLEFFNSHWLQILIIIIISYLIGCLNFSIIISGMLGEKKDIRNMGSGNAGFTNMLRSVGIGPAAVTFIGDFLKGVMAVCLGKFIMQINLDSGDKFTLLQYGACVAGLMCLIGHIYPCFFGFRGGKGVLTTWAITLFIDWRVFLIIITVFLITLICSRIVSLSSIAAATSYPIVTFASCYIINYRNSGDIYYIAFLTSLSLLEALIVVLKHKENILRLMSGTEKKIKSKTKI